jgi:hypothetical protein
VTSGSPQDRADEGAESEAEPFGEELEAEPTPDAEPEGAYVGYGREEAFPLEEEYHTALPRKVEAWRQRSAAGAILTGMALGLQQALGTERNEPAIVVQTSGDPPRDLPVEADFEFRRPRQSVVNIRPWLLDSSDVATDGSATDGSATDGSDVATDGSEGETQAPANEGRTEPPEP